MGYPPKLARDLAQVVANNVSSADGKRRLSWLIELLMLTDSTFFNMFMGNLKESLHYRGQEGQCGTCSYSSSPIGKPPTHECKLLHQQVRPYHVCDMYE